MTATQLSFPIHRMIQLQRKYVPYGSQTNNGELRFASLSSILSLGDDDRIKADHYTALVMMNELTELVIQELVDNRGVGGMVVIIPNSVCGYSDQHYVRRIMTKLLANARL